MKKLLAFLLVLVMGMSVVGCVDTTVTTDPEDDTVVDDGTTVDDGATTDPVDEVVELEPLELSDSLKINISMGNNLRTITYQQTTPLEFPDGTITKQGDLKYTWQYFSEQIGVAFEDVAVQDQKGSEMIDVQAATGFTEATVYGGNGISEDLMSYGTQGYFVDLNDYMDYMPNFKAYLTDNPNVKTALTAYDGGMYLIPYTAEIGNYARAFEGREDWFYALLDSTDALVDETKTLDVAYEGYWDRNATNVVDLQNAAATNGTLSREAALDTLLAYIADTYPDLEKPSDLYLGLDAQYDIDELVALWRVVKLSPNTLSKLATGEVVADAEISPFFVRQSKYREDLLRLITYFDGERVYGSDSYGVRFYLDENSELHYSYAEDGFLEGVDYLAQMYSEGLIHSEFSDETVKDNFRTIMLGSDTAEGQRQFGFMTNDWFASTTAVGDNTVGILPPVTSIDGYTDEFIHYVENTRSIKSDGWSISVASSQEEINAAITLFDYIYSADGSQAQVYGPPAVIDGTVEYNGVTYPKFSPWMLEQADTLASSDVSAFLRDFVGSLIPIGYQKNIGFEKQYTNENGMAAWELYEGAEVLMTSYEAENPVLKMLPPLFSLTEQDSAKINTLSIGDDQVDQIFLYITGNESALDSVADIKALYEASGIEEYVDVYAEAYARMTE
jgi:hypothetical protein